MAFQAAAAPRAIRALLAALARQPCGPRSPPARAGSWRTGVGEGRPRGGPAGPPSRRGFNRWLTRAALAQEPRAALAGAASRQAHRDHLALDRDDGDGRAGGHLAGLDRRMIRRLNPARFGRDRFRHDDAISALPADLSRGDGLDGAEINHHLARLAVGDEQAIQMDRLLAQRSAAANL